MLRHLPGRRPTADSEASPRRLGQLGRTATQLTNEVLKLIIGDIDVPPSGNIRPALAGRLLEGFELGFPNALALLNEAEPFTQHLAGVLVAPGLHEGLYQLPEVVEIVGRYRQLPPS